MSGVLLRLTAYRDDASGPFNTPVSRAELRDLRIAEPQLEDYTASPRPPTAVPVRDTPSYPHRTGRRATG